MKEGNLKNRLIHWLKNSNPDDAHLAEEILKYEGNDEVILGAKMFLENNNKSLSEMRDVISVSPTRKAASLNMPPVKSYLLAASILLVVSLTLMFLCQSNSKRSQFLVYEEGIPVFMGHGSKPYLQEFMNLYRLGEYEQAKQTGVALVKKNSSDTLHYFLGCCFNYTNEYETALQYLNQVKNPPASFVAGLHYQKIFAHLMSGNRNAAKKILLQLKNNPDPIHKEKIIALSEELE